MKTITINLYQFSELSENSKQKALENLSDINVEFDWWEFIYEDATNVGIKITGFDIGRGSYCKIKKIDNCQEIAANIIRDHGENCDTFQTANDFLEEFNPVFANYMDENSENYESNYLENKMMGIEEYFIENLAGDYLKMLHEEYEYLTSEEAIIETIEANKYDFTEDGELY